MSGDEHNKPGESWEDQAERYPLEGEVPLGSGPELSAVEAELSRVSAELHEAREKYLRSIADFQNYQRRALQNEQVARVGGIASVVQNVANVMDHFDVALSHDPARASAEQVIEGLRVIRDEMLKALQQSGVRVVRPEPNDEFQPGIHEAVMQQPAEGVEPGRIVRTFQPGYVLGERVIRSAKVVVSP